MLTWAIAWLTVKLVQQPDKVKGDLDCLFVLAMTADTVIVLGVTYLVWSD